MNLEEAVWYVAAAYGAVLVLLLVLFAFLARRALRLSRQVQALQEGAAGEPPAAPEHAAGGAGDAGGGPPVDPGGSAAAEAWSAEDKGSPAERPADDGPAGTRSADGR